MSAQATIGIEPFIPPDLSFPRVISFGLTAAEFAWCLDPNGHPIVPPLPSARILDIESFEQFADRTQPVLSFKAIALLASEFGIEVSAIKKTHRFEGYYDAKISSSTSRPWTPAREWAAIQRIRKLVWEEKYELARIEPDYVIEGTNSIDFRGSRKPETEETRAAFAAEKERLEGIIKESNYWSPLDPPEYTQTINGRKVNTKNKRFVEMAFALSRLYKNHDSQKKLAADLGLNLETERKKELPMINRDKPFPTTPLPADDRLAALMGSDLGGNVYVHVTLDRGRWYSLDMDKHDTYAAAIEEVRWKSQDEAWKQAGVPSRRTDARTIGDNPDLALAFKEVVVRFEEAFNHKNLFILDLRSPTVAAFAEIEWEEQCTVHQSGVIDEGGNQ